MMITMPGTRRSWCPRCFTSARPSRSSSCGAFWSHRINQPRPISTPNDITVHPPHTPNQTKPKTHTSHTQRYIAPPHVILRKALIQGTTLPTLSADLAEFMARNLFFTSSLHLTGPEKRARVAFWSGNHGLCALTEAVVFTEPYFDVPHNRWTSPQLDGEVQVGGWV